jgi:phosphohistidine phosphatase
LDLVRHGEALATSDQGDAGRTLSERGRAVVSALAERFVRERWRPDSVWASPLLRAQQTAAILAGRACPGVAVETLGVLTPDHGPDDVIEELRARGARGHVVLVGHQPLMGDLVARLCAKADGSFAAGGLIRIEFPGPLARGAGTLTLQIRPDAPSA